MKKQEIVYQLKYNPSSIKEMEQHFREKNMIDPNVTITFYKINGKRDKLLLTDEYLQNRKRKNLADVTMEILVEVDNNANKINSRNCEKLLEINLSESLIFNDLYNNIKEVNFELVTNTILEYLEKNYEKEDFQKDNILHDCIKDEILIKEFISKYGNLKKIMDFYQRKMETSEKKLQIASIFISNLEDFLNESNKKIKELNEKIYKDKEILRIDYEKQMSEKINQWNIREEEYKKNLENLMNDFNSLKISITSVEFDIKNIQQEYKDVNYKIESLNCDNYIIDNDNIKQALSQKIENNKNIKLVTNEIVKIISDIQINVKQYLEFVENIEAFGSLILFDFKGVYNKESDISSSDISIFICFLKLIKSIFSEIFENIDLEKISKYQILTLEKQYYCNICNKFYQKNTGETSLKCKEHFSCENCYKEYSNFFKKNTCFCKLLKK